MPFESIQASRCTAVILRAGSTSGSIALVHRIRDVRPAGDECLERYRRALALFHAAHRNRLGRTTQRSATGQPRQRRVHLYQTKSKAVLQAETPAPLRQDSLSGSFAFASLLRVLPLQSTIATWCEDAEL